LTSANVIFFPTEPSATNYFCPLITLACFTFPNLYPPKKSLKLFEFKPWFIWKLSGLMNQFHNSPKLHDSLSSRVVNSRVSTFRLSLSVLIRAGEQSMVGLSMV